MPSEEQGQLPDNFVTLPKIKSTSAEGDSVGADTSGRELPSAQQSWGHADYTEHSQSVHYMDQHVH